MHDVSLTEDIAYATHDGTRLMGDYLRPKTEEICPIVIAVHGSAFYKGNSKYFHNWGTWLAARGIAVFSIHYRLVKGTANRYPAAIADVRAAVQFVRGEAASLASIRRASA